MIRRSKQKSCFACVDAKRRCDMSLPSCSRCIDRATDCVYPLVARSLQRSQAGLAGHYAVPGVGFSHMWDSAAIDGGSESLYQIQDTSGDVFLDAAFTPGLVCAASSFEPFASTASDNPDAAQLTRFFGDMRWFLQPQAWAVDYHYIPPDTVPPPPVLLNFIRGLKEWLSRFVRNGHNPFIHRHLYSETGFPQCLQNAYSAIAISKITTPDNELIADNIFSTHISELLVQQPAVDSMSSNLLSTRDHLARTQALLMQLLLSLFSSSVARRARAESLIGTLRDWTGELWESAMRDKTIAPPFPTLSTGQGEINVGDVDPVPELYRGFALSESLRRTWLLCNFVTGVYGGLKGELAESCGGDIHITTRADLWEATSSARWEAIARHCDPLFVYSLHGQTLVDRGIGAAQVDEFARHLFTVMWGLEKVESWVVRTGDEVSVTY